MSAVRHTGVTRARRAFPPAPAPPPPDPEVLRGYASAIVRAARAAAAAKVAEEEARAARDLRVAEGLKAGLSLSLAASAAGISYGMVRVIAREHGVRMKPGRRPGQRRHHSP